VPPQTEADLPRLVKLASHNDWQVAYLGAELLGDVGAAAIPALKLAMGTGNWIQRAIVARSLERIGDPAAAPILRERLKEMENGTRAAIYSALAAICDSVDYEAMRLGLFDRCTAVQAACARGLTRLAQREPSLQMRQTLPRLHSISAPWRLEESGEKRAARAAIAAIELATRSDSTLPIPARPSSDENLPIPSGPASRCTDNLAIPH
jgi:HEAT repeat protein